MPTPIPDPAGRPSSNSAEVGPHSAKGSTGSHRNADGDVPAASEIRSHSSFARGLNAADLVAHIPLPSSSDDAPTVITQAGKAAVPLPVGPHVVGEGRTIAGRILGHFELIDAIGAGGMAAVLKARDLELGRIVALKILPPESALDPENVTRFKQEARAAAKLDHDNVARVYFCGEDQGLHFIAFEFVEGITLRQTIDWRGPLAPGDCVRLMIQVAAGLAHAADRGVVHRDIKPSNILITPDGRVKIVDMGLARHLESQSVNGGVTQSGVTLGTFDYISPEQALDPRQADVRSDIYSLGCAFYHALTGRPPVPEGTAAKKIYAHQRLDPLDPRELNPAIPDELAAVLARMMAKEPQRRYQTPAELIAHLKGIAERFHYSLEAVASDATVQAVAADDRVLPRAPKLRIGWVAAAAAVVAAIVAIVVAANGPDLSSNPPRWTQENGKPKPDGWPNGWEPGAKSPPVKPVSNERPVKTVEELAAALADSHTTKIALAAGEYDLSRLDRPIAFQGSQLTLAGSMNPPTIIRVAAGKRESPGSLTLSAAGVTLRGIRFEVVLPPDGEALGEFTGVSLLDAARVQLEDCSFIPNDRARKAGSIALAIAAPASETSSIYLNRCLFAPGAIGLRAPSRSTVEVGDSGFAPHTAAIQIRDDASVDEPPSLAITHIRLAQASFMLDSYSAAVEVDPSASQDVSVEAGNCVFAPAYGVPPEPRMPDMMDAPTQGVILRNASKNHDVKVAALPGRQNAYYNVAAQPSAKAVPLEEPGFVKLAQRPWDPAGGVLAAFATYEPWTAFRLTLTGPSASPQVFLPKSALGVMGAQFHDPKSNTRLAYHGVERIWPPLPPAPAEITTRVWWPAKPESASLKPDREYTDLVKLLRDARSGDTILIRHDGPLPMEKIVIQPPKTFSGGDRGDFHLTFKPETKNLRPILVPAQNELDVSIFRIREGRVLFEDLHFNLKPDQPNTRDQIAAVSLVAGRGCEFKNCTFTLQEEDGKVATVVALADSREMKMDGPASRTVPELKFTGCLIRGKGRVLSVPISRPFSLDMTQCITGLNGPVIFAKAGGREVDSALRSNVHLTRVTGLLGGPLVALQGGRFGAMKSSGLVATTVTAEHCLFAAVPGAGQPMLDVDGAELDRSDPKNSILKWSPQEANRFANFDPSSAPLVVKPDLETKQDWRWTEWLQFAREVCPMGRVTFENGPHDLTELMFLRPGSAEVKGVAFPDMPDAKPGDAGADPDKVANPPDGRDG